MAEQRSEVEGLKTRLRAMRTALDTLDSTRDKTLDRRRQLFVRLTDAGVSNAEIAKLAGISDVAVGQQIRKAKES